jgi:hypothetical protein
MELKGRLDSILQLVDIIDDTRKHMEMVIGLVSAHLMSSAGRGCRETMFDNAVSTAE